MEEEIAPVTNDTTVCANADVVSKIIKYEVGELTEEEELDLFKNLVKTGLAWTLQGHYGRRAKMLIDEGYISLKED